VLSRGSSGGLLRSLRSGSWTFQGSQEARSEGAGRREGHRATYSCVRQVKARWWHLLSQRALVGTDGFDRSRRERKKIQTPFARFKRILRLGRLRLRGPQGALDEFVLAAIAQNLRRLASLVARPPPLRFCAVRSVGVA
jgi:hypothetical protein